MSSFEISENSILILPQDGDAKSIMRIGAESESISMEDLFVLIKQIDYQKPAHTKIRISEAFLEELKSWDIIQYDSNVTMSGLRMIIDNNIATYKFE